MCDTSAAMLLLIALLFFALMIFLAEDQLKFIDRYILRCPQRSNLVETAVQSQKPNGKNWSSEERRHHRIERLFWVVSAILTFAAATGAVATVIVSDLTLKEARNATRQTTRQADAACKAYEPTLIVGQILLHRLKEPKAGLQIWINFLNIGGNSAIATKWAIQDDKKSPVLPYVEPTQNLTKNINAYFRPSTLIADVSPIAIPSNGLDPTLLNELRSDGNPQWWFYGYIQFRDTWNRKYVFNFCQVTHKDGIVGDDLNPGESVAIPIETCDPEKYHAYESDGETQRIDAKDASGNGC